MSLTAPRERMLVAMGLSPMQRRAAGESLRAAPMPAAASPAATSPAATLPAATPAARPGALLEALRRAAGGRDIADLVADLDRLRREPALKRALWPRLRALRRH